GPLVLGACREQADRYDEAVAIYSDFAAQHPNARGVAALRAKAQLALRAAAERAARQALAREAELALAPPEPATVAVLPLVIAGDSGVQPLSRGLAELIATDLAYIRTLRLLERLQIGMLLDELKLGQSDRVDPATAARVGRLLRAEREQILRQGPKSLAAFLAYSRALEAMDRGDYGAAARHFRSAAQADPGFQAARDGQEAATAAPAAEQATGGGMVTLPDAVER